MVQLSYRRHRFPAEIIQHAIWLYLRFTLSYRDVEELLAERGLDVSYETVRRWVLKFGPLIARKLLKKQGFAPKLLVTDKLGSYGSAFRQLRLTCPHDRGLRKTIALKTPINRAATRAQDAAVQVVSIRAAVSQHPFRRPQHLQPSTTSRLSVHTSDLQSRNSRPVARRGCRRMKRV